MVESIRHGVLHVKILRQVNGGSALSLPEREAPHHRSDGALPSIRVVHKRKLFLAGAKA